MLSTHLRFLNSGILLLDGAYSDEQEEKDIISELKVLKHVGAHPNIVCLLGASVNNGRSQYNVMISHTLLWYIVY